jgi:hypothetical protein
MTDPEDVALLVRAAGRARTRPEFMGWLLARFQELEGCTELGLATRLGIQSGDLQRLALCLRPRTEEFIDDVAAIAAKVGCDAAVLIHLVRLVESTEAMREVSVSAGKAGLLMAARARKNQPKKEK